MKSINISNKKKAFIKILAKSKHPLSVDELYLQMRNSGMKISMSTVYRYLHLLSEERQIKSTKTNYRLVLFYLDPL